jgi:hypothetical protein
MSKESKRSPIQEDVMAREEDQGVQQEALNLQDEDDETKVATVTPPPSSAGEAATARNSTPSPPAASQEKGSGNDLSPPPVMPAKRKVSIARMKIFRSKKETMEDKLDSHPRDEEQTLPPCSEKTSLSVKSLHSWSKRAARSRSQAKCRGEENKRKAVITPLQSYASTEAPANRPPKKRISIRINENPRNEANDESFIQRVLRDVDTEIGLLNGIIDYYTRNETYPFDDFKALDDFIDNWLQVDVPDDEQLIDVVRKLRKKYLRNMTRTGASVNFADPRVQRAFNLANQLWGAGRNEEYWKGLKMKWQKFYWMN